jgi:uncharacterized protein YfaS (alpha-2-macroglobulin family)
LRSLRENLQNIYSMTNELIINVTKGITMNRICKMVALFLTLLFVVFAFLSCKDAELESSSNTSSSESGIVGSTRPVFENRRIIYYDAQEVAARIDDSAAIEESDDPFTIVDFGPVDELPSEIKKPSIYAVFSQPVVPLAQLGEVIREDAAVFEINPPLKGVYRWYGTKLLSFEPDDEIIPQQKFTVTVSGRLQSLGGKRLAGNRTFEFETERLSVLTWRLGNGKNYVNTRSAHPEDAKNILVYFSYPVELEEIAKWIEVSGANRGWNFYLSRPEEVTNNQYSIEQTVQINIREPLPMDTNFTLTIKKGARSKSEYLGSLEDKTFKFKTLDPFQFNSANVYFGYADVSTDANPVRVSLYFNYAVEERDIEQHISVDGFPPLTKENIEVYGSNVTLVNLPFEYNTNYQVRFSPQLKDIMARTIPNQFDQSVRVNIGEADSYVRIRDGQSRMLEAAYNPLYAWEVQNPLSLKRSISNVDDPYRPLDLVTLQNVDTSNIQRNARFFFMDELSQYLNAAGKGFVGMRWQYQEPSTWEKDRVYTYNNWLNLQVTDLGLTVRYAYNKVIVWVTHLSDGSPAANAKVELISNYAKEFESVTDENGLCVFNLSDEISSLFARPYTAGYEKNNFGLRIRVTENGGLASGGDQVDFIPNNSHNHWRFDFASYIDPFNLKKDQRKVFLFTDRGLYKPGETVTFRGIDRQLEYGDYTPYSGAYEISVEGNDGTVIAKLSGNTTMSGGSFGSFDVPSDAMPGAYYIRYKAGSATQLTTFTVANFERLRFEASLAIHDQLYYLGDDVAANLSASYLAGGSLNGAFYNYYWTSQVMPFNPMGIWSRWNFAPAYNGYRNYLSQGEGALSASGNDRLAQKTESRVEGAAELYRIEAGVQDAARQQVSATASVIVHPAEYYIASRIDEGTLRAIDRNASSSSARILAAGEEASLSWALVKPDGDFFDAPRDWNGNVKAQLIRYEWKTARQAGVGGQVNLVWEKVEHIESEDVIPLSAIRGELSGVIDFIPQQSGEWEVRLSSEDTQGRKVLTKYQFYVSGAGWVRWGADDADVISITTDKDTYAPGETATLMIRSPLEKGKYLLTIEREGIISEKIIELDGSAETIEIPIDESHVPIVYVALSSYTVRSAPPDNTYNEPDLDKPKGIFGLTSIYVDTSSRQYDIEINVPKGVYAPAEEAEVELTVTQNGKPVEGVELSFLAVDRGVVDLINYHVPNPLSFFYNPSNFPLGVAGADSRSLLIDPVTYSLADLQGGDAEGDDKLGDNERSDWRPTAVFEPYLVTDEKGKAIVTFKLPDNLTTYRATAIAVGVDRFGITEDEIKVSAPLTAVAALPRQLRWRDTGSASLILTNLENESVEAEVSLAIEHIDGTSPSGLEVDGEAIQKIEIPAASTREILFDIAAVAPGEARLTFTLHSPKVNERIVHTLNVSRPMLYETVTTIGNLADDKTFIEEGIVLPSAIPEGTGTLSLSVSASRLALLKESVDYLFYYPYGCLEQRTARLLPIISFGEHLDAFGFETDVDIEKLIQDELNLIAQNQLPDGAFPYWGGTQYGDYYVTLRVAHILHLAKQNGYAVPENIDTRLMLNYLSSSDYVRRFVRNNHFLYGYMLWVRAMYDENIGSEINEYLSRGDVIGISGFGFAGMAALEIGRENIANDAKNEIKKFIRPGTRTLDITDTYESVVPYWGYDTNKYALALMLHYSLEPNSDMTTRLANSLLERQRAGKWGSTATNYWAILAYSWISEAESQQETNFTANTSLVGTLLQSSVFNSYGGVPVSNVFTFEDDLLKNISRDTLLPLRIERNGEGNLYYTASLKYGLATELADARDEGISVFVKTFDENGNEVNDGILIAGKTYTRKAVISTSRARTNLALRVPVPSGAEIIDAVFVTSSTEPPQENNRREEIDWSNWIEPPIQFVMNDEVQFHWGYFKQGLQEVEFRFRAVMPGIYPTPAANA